MNLAEGGKSVSEIVEQTGLSQPLVSHHLKELKNNLIVKTERKSSFVFYELTEPTILELLRLTNQLVVELSEKSNSAFSPEYKLSVPFSMMMKKMSKIMNQSLKEK
jgi:DNA-binding transcriptional ArsR family regulator